MQLGFHEGGGFLWGRGGFKDNWEWEDCKWCK